MIIKILFWSAVALHRPWPPILISFLFYPSLFLVLGHSFFTARVFLVEIAITKDNSLVQNYCKRLRHPNRTVNLSSVTVTYTVNSNIVIFFYTIIILGTKIAISPSPSRYSLAIGYLTIIVEVMWLYKKIMTT